VHGQAVIEDRRAQGDAGERADLLSYFLTHTGEDGKPYSDKVYINSTSSIKKGKTHNFLANSDRVSS
jgi:hypothetical protein